MIVSSDGRKLYVGGVGDRIWVHDTETLDLLKIVVADGDFMMGLIEIPNPGLSASPSDRQN